MTTSKILVPAGTNADGTKNMVPVDVEIPQPLHVVIDSDGGDSETIVAFDFTDIVSNNIGLGSFDVYSASLVVLDDPQSEDGSVGFSVGGESSSIETLLGHLPLKDFCMFTAQTKNVTIQDPSSSHSVIGLTFGNSQDPSIAYVQASAFWRATQDADKRVLTIGVNFSSIQVPQDTTTISFSFESDDR